MKRTASKYEITVVWMYGTPGHGRGLVDAMAWFGCKQPLKKEIITNDIWFHTAEEMTEFLINHFEDDKEKEYYCISAKTTAEKRSKPNGEHILTPCMIYRLIDVNKEGRFIRKLYLDETKLEELFEKEDHPEDVSNIDLEEAEYENEDWSLNQDTVFELIEPGTFVAVRSSTNAFEPFYLIEIVDKGIASYNITDSYGHMILKCERYAEGIYLEKQTDFIRNST